MRWARGRAQRESRSKVRFARERIDAPDRQGRKPAAQRVRQQQGSRVNLQATTCLTFTAYQLKRAFSDGITHGLFEPNDFIARVASLVPRSRAHLIRYHGLFAPNARHRHLVVPTKSTVPSTNQSDNINESPKPHR